MSDASVRFESDVEFFTVIFLYIHFYSTSIHVTSNASLLCFVKIQLALSNYPRRYYSTISQYVYYTQNSASAFRVRGKPWQYCILILRHEARFQQLFLFDSYIPSHPSIVHRHLFSLYFPLSNPFHRHSFFLFRVPSLSFSICLLPRVRYSIPGILVLRSFLFLCPFVCGNATRVENTLLRFQARNRSRFGLAAWRAMHIYFAICVHSLILPRSDLANLFISGGQLSALLFIGIFYLPFYVLI